MAATAIAVVPKTRAVQWDGTNSADIDALISDFTIISETSTHLTMQSSTATHVCPLNGFILFDEAGVVYDIVQSAAFPGRFHQLALADQLADLEATVEALPAVVGSVGAATFAPIAPLDTVTVRVPLTPPMPSDGYTPEATLFGSVDILSSVTIGDVTVVDEAAIDVEITNNGLVALGGSVLVTAIA